MILEGKLVRLRPLTPADAEITWRWRQGERAKYLNRGARTVEEQRAWILRNQGEGEFNFIMEYQGEPVGTISIYGINQQHKSALIGRLIVGEDGRVGNAPVAAEAELLICDYIFRDLGLHKIHGDIVEDNVGVVKFRAYLGYHQDGVLRDHFWDGTAYRNMIAVSLLDKEYFSQCRPRLVALIELLSRYSTEAGGAPKRPPGN
jgi:RimJ/RimL family protein N-acetyltransferase